jgi:hypothetical protein
MAAIILRQRDAPMQFGQRHGREFGLLRECFGLDQTEIDVAP